jgi:hypothetical protein
MVRHVTVRGNFKTSFVRCAQNLRVDQRHLPLFNEESIPLIRAKGQKVVVPSEIR